ncbi:sensor domain-containing protein [Haloarchaeobius amylolyticus]|uniref:sensor domain-containing protein n=1 Tax=Haloarchaeobius amylolyticus TaxID=1198296 RepID=UPI002270D0F3|nr:sensor domain-containing protein [Haloarchaeobius amylolyticus]
MSQTESRIATDPAALLWQLVGVPVRLQTYKNLLYLALAFPLGLFYFVALVSGVSAGTGTLVVVVGVPILLVTLVVGTAFMRIETELARHLLGFDVPTRTGDATLEDGVLEYVKDLLTDYGTYVSLVVTFAKFWVGVGSFVALVVWSVVSTVFMAAPFYYDRPGVSLTFGPEGSVTLLPALQFTEDFWTITLTGPVEFATGEVTTLQGALVVSAIGVVLLFLGFHLLNAAAWLLGYATKLLGPHARVIGSD